MSRLASFSEQLQEAWHQIVFQWELATAGAQDMQWIDTLDFFWDSLPDGDKLSAKQKRQIAHSLKALVRQQSTDLYHKQQSHKEAISRRQEHLAQQALENLANKRLEQMRTMSYLAREQSSILPAASQLLLASAAAAAAQQQQGQAGAGSRPSQAPSSSSSSRSSSLGRRQQQQQQQQQQPPLARMAAAGRRQSLLPHVLEQHQQQQQQDQETALLLDSAIAAAAAESGKLRFGEMEAMQELQPSMQQLGVAMQGQESMQDLQQLLSGALSLYVGQLPDTQQLANQQQQQQQQGEASNMWPQQEDAPAHAAADTAVVIDIPASGDSFTFGSHIPHFRASAPAAAAAWPAGATAAAADCDRGRESGSSSSRRRHQGLLSQAPQGALTEPLLQRDVSQQQQEAGAAALESYEPPMQQQQQCAGVSGGQQLLLERYLSSEHHYSHDLSAATAATNAAAAEPRGVPITSFAGCGCVVSPVETQGMSLQSHNSVSSSCSSDASSEHHHHHHHHHHHQQQQQQLNGAHTDQQQQQQHPHHHQHNSKQQQQQQGFEAGSIGHKAAVPQPGSSSRWSCDTSSADVDTPRCRDDNARAVAGRDPCAH